MKRPNTRGQLWRRLRPVLWVDQLALARDLTLPLPDLPFAGGVTVRTASGEDFPRLAATIGQVFRRPVEGTRGTLLDEFRDRHRRGHVCGIGERTGQILAMIWVRFDEAVQSQMRARVRLDPDEAYAYALFTMPTHRGRGLGTTVAAFMARWLVEQGARRVYAWAGVGNTASLKTVRRFAFQPAARMRQLRWRLGVRAALLNYVVYDPTSPLSEWCSPQRLEFGGGQSIFRPGGVDFPTRENAQPAAPRPSPGGQDD